MTLPPEQINPEPVQFDDALNRGHNVALHPARKKAKNKK
jgi:hypothetical protein